MPQLYILHILSRVQGSHASIVKNNLESTKQGMRHGISMKKEERCVCIIDMLCTVAPSFTHTERPCNRFPNFVSSHCFAINSMASRAEAMSISYTSIHHTFPRIKFKTSVMSCNLGLQRALAKRRVPSRLKRTSS